MGHISKPFGIDADDEHDADKFARDILIDEVAFNAFAKNGYLTRATISQFAARNTYYKYKRELRNAISI